MTGESDSGTETAVRPVIIEADCSVTGESDSGTETAVSPVDAVVIEADGFLNFFCFMNAESEPLPSASCNIFIPRVYMMSDYKNIHNNVLYVCCTM